MQGWLYRQGKLRGFTESFARSYAKSYVFKNNGAGATEVAKETAKALLGALRKHGIPMPDEVCRRLLACEDLAQIETWIDETICPGVVEAPWPCMLSPKDFRPPPAAAPFFTVAKSAPPGAHEQDKLAARAEGEANALLVVLRSRGFSIPDDVRERIFACKEIPQIETWIERALVATRLEDILSEHQEA